jgi:hypothetical protein
VLERSAGTPSNDRLAFPRAHAGGLIAIVAGAASLIAALIMQFGGQRQITEPPNAWVTVPLLVLAALGAGVAFFRREPHRPMAIVGVGMATAALALGWVIVAAAVAAGTVLACVIIAKFM